MALDFQGDILDSIDAVAISGALAENTTNAPLRGGISEVAIPCGRAVCQGTGDGQVKLPTTAAEVAACWGVAVYLPMRKELPDGADYALKDTCLFLEKGEIFVYVEEAVSAGAQCFVRFATNSALDKKGAFLDNASVTGGAATAAPLPNCKFTSSTTGEGIAKVRLNLPGSDPGLIGNLMAAVANAAAGGILYFDGTQFVMLPIGSNGQVLKVTSNLPAWGTDT